MDTTVHLEVAADVAAVEVVDIDGERGVGRRPSSVVPALGVHDQAITVDEEPIDPIEAIRVAGRSLVEQRRERLERGLHHGQVVDPKCRQYKAIPSREETHRLEYRPCAALT